MKFAYANSLHMLRLELATGRTG